eukprot:1188198-Amphidinium_carterae.2
MASLDFGHANAPVQSVNVHEVEVREKGSEASWRLPSSSREVTLPDWSHFSAPGTVATELPLQQQPSLAARTRGVGLGGSGPEIFGEKT